MIADNIQRTEGPRTVVVRALIGHLGHQERSEFGVDVTCMLYSSLAMQRTNGPQKTAASRQWPYHLKPDGIW